MRCSVRKPELSMSTRRTAKPVVISSANGHQYTNGGSQTCLETAFAMITAGTDVLEALVAGVSIVELDPLDNSVGYGGLPNADGVVQLDSCCMHGPTKRAGGVAALEGVKTPSLVAYRVMQETDHHLLAGKGAQDFARAVGFEVLPDLNTDASRKAWIEWKRRTDALHDVDPIARDLARAARDGGDGRRRVHQPEPRLRHDQLQRRQRRRRRVRRDDDERAGMEDSRARRRLADSRRGPLR